MSGIERSPIEMSSVCLEWLMPYHTVVRQHSPITQFQQLFIASRNLEIFTNGYRCLIQILPATVVVPMHFSGKIEFGVINQSVSAFNHILADFSLIVCQFQAISAFSTVIDRLGYGVKIILGYRKLSNISQAFQFNKIVSAEHGSAIAIGDEILYLCRVKTLCRLRVGY